MINQAEMNEVQGADSWRAIFLSLSEKEEAEFQKTRKGSSSFSTSERCF